MGLGFFLFIGGLVITLGLYAWLKQRQPLGYIPAEDAPTISLPVSDNDDAVIVSREHGQLLYINEHARQWLGLTSGNANLEYLASLAQPAESFLDLFAAEGQASFQLGTRWVEASSHTIPNGAETRRVVVMREITANTNSPDALDLSLAIRTINEIGETVNASMSMNQVYQALLAIVMKAVPADAGEICLWDAPSKTLTPKGWVGDSNYLLKLHEIGGVYKLNEGVSGWIAYHKRPALVVSIYDGTVVQPRLSGFFKSYVGIPLQLGDRFIGTFELAHRQVGHFGQPELALLQAVGRQVATAIYNTELYDQQAQRITDMASLGDLLRGEKALDDARSVYRNLNARMANIVNAEFCGILLYDEDRRALVPELPFFGLPDNLAQSCLIPMPADSPQRDIWERQPYWVTNDAQDEPLIEALGLRPVFGVAGIKNTALLPLEIGDQRIGMAQISNKRAVGGFSAQDIREMRLLVAQAANVVENLRLHQREQRRDTELSGLQEIAHAIGSLSREEEFYSTINERIASAMGVGMCGIMLYDEANARLVSQLPFFGIGDDLVRDYGISLERGTPLADLWDESDFWYSNRTRSDAVVYAAGLAEFADKLGVQKTLLVVLSVGGRRLGVVQASNKLNGEDFNDKDARLLLIFATQVAAMIENARLYRGIQASADQATRLRTVAEMAGAILRPDDPFKPMLAEIAALTRSPVVFLNLLDQHTGSLVTHPQQVYGAALAEPVTYDIYSKQFANSVALSHQTFISNHLEQDKRVLALYRDTVNAFDLRSVVLVPLVVGDRSLGELGVANRAAEPYDNTDEKLLVAIAAQIAATIERLRLYEAAGENLSRRVLELDAISHISNELTQTLDLNRVLDVIRQEAARATDADGSTIVLLKPPALWAAPDAPELDMRVGGRDDFGGLADIEQDAIRGNSHMVLIPDYSTNGHVAMPAGVRSAIATAFLYESEVVGVLHLYHQRPNHFDERGASFLLTLSAKASLGFGNFKRYQEQLERSNRLRRRVEQLNQIFELGQMLQTNLDQVELLESILEGIQESVGFDAGVVLLTDVGAGVLRRVAQAGMPLDVFETSKTNTLKLDDLTKLLTPAFQISESFFFPSERRSEWESCDLTPLRTTYLGQRTLPDAADEKAWHDGDLLLLPMLGPGGAPLGVVSLDRPQDGLRPDRTTLEVLEIFVHQASTTVENIRLYLSSLESAEQEARLNEMMESISSTLDVQEIVEAVAQGALRLIPISRMTVALVNADESGYDLLNVSIANGSDLRVHSEERASLNGMALYQAIQDGQDALFLSDDTVQSSFDDVREWRAQGENTSLVIPLLTGGSTLGAMHFGSELTEAVSFNEYRPLLKRMANLAAVAIQNARLFKQALNLQNFNDSVVQSIQQGIIVLDRTGRVLSINDYMRVHYGWEIRKALRQNLFDYSPELEPLLKDDLNAALQLGKLGERIWQPTQAEDGATRVRNFYTYPLLSGETVRGAVLLVEDVTERARLERDVEARANQLAVLTEVSSRITASLKRDEVVNLVLEEIGRIISYDTMTLWRRTGDMLVLVGASDASDSVHALSETQFSLSTHERMRWVAERKAPYSISNLRGIDPLPGEEGCKSWMGVPLVNQENVVGVIALAKHESDYYDTQAEQAAFAFANQVAIALENANLYAEAQYQTERLSLLNRVSVQLAQSLDSENILEVGLREIAQAMQINNARAMVLERDIQLARVIVTHPRGDTPPDEIIPIANSAVYQAARRSAQPLFIEDVRVLKADDPLRIELEARGLLAYMLIPMTVAGQVIGVFEMEDRVSARTFTPEQIDLGLIIANQAAIAVQNTNLLEQTLVRTRELETLLEAAQATSLTLNLDDAYIIVTDLILHALNMDQCAVMMWDNVENAVEVVVDRGRYGDNTHAIPIGTQYNLRQHPAMRRALEDREIVVIRAEDEIADATERAVLQTGGYALGVLIPLVVRDQAIGVIWAQLTAQHYLFSHREVRLAQALGAQAAIAIQNARLSSETAALVEEGFILNTLSQAISSTLTIEKMIATVREQVPQVTHADEMYLALYEADTQTITFPMAVRKNEDIIIPPRQLNTDEVSFIIKHRRSLNLGGGNWSSDDMRRNLSIRNGEGDARCYLGVPVASGDQVLGVLALRDSQNTRAFGINDERLLMTVGTQLGAAIQNARLYKQVSTFAEELNQRVQERTVELQQERDRLDTLYRITSELARTLDMDRVLRRALEMVAGAVQAKDGVIMLIDPLSDKLLTRAALQPVVVTNGDDSHPAEMVATWLLQNERVLVAEDLRETSYWNPNQPGAKNWRSALAVLLESNDDPQGVLVLLSEEVSAFSDSQLKLATAAANQVAAAINNADLYHLIRDQAERLGMLVRLEQEESEKNSAIVEGIADGVMLADADGAIVLFNGAAERVLGLSRDQVIGQAMFRLTGLFGGSATQWGEAIENWTHNPESHRPGEFLEERLDLGTKVVQVHLSPVYNNDRFLGTVSVFRDITKEVEVDRIKSEFVSNVSHELRTPMTSIKGYADLLLMGVAGNVSDQQRGFLSKIKSNADRLSRLVDDLLNISKLDAGEQMAITVVDLHALLSDTLHTVAHRTEHEAKKMHTELDIAPDLPKIEADVNKLTQIITNVIDNAFNYTYEGGQVTVKATYVPDDERVLISISDTGIGIPEEFKSRIWGRFERVETHALVMDVPGTGLGLSIVRELVQMHHGDIWFESEIGKGTTFFIALPLNQLSA
jgi:PAS domain S-box-containing protein